MMAGTWRSSRLLAAASFSLALLAGLAPACSGSGDGPEASGPGADAGVDPSAGGFQGDALEALNTAARRQKLLPARPSGAWRAHAKQLIPRRATSGEGYAVDLQVSLRAREPLRIAPIGQPKLTLTWTAQQGANVNAEISEEGRAVYRAENGSADVVRTLAAGGLHESLVIRDARSPSVYSWKLDLAASLRAEPAADDAVALVDEAGAVQLLISAVTLVDGKGQTRRAPLRVADGYATLHIDHRTAVYPLVADYALTAPTKMQALALAPTQIKGRVMLILDTSGSMLYGFGDSTSRGADGDSRAVFCDNDLYSGSDAFRCSDNVACTTGNGGRGYWRLADIANPSRMFAAKEALSNVINAHAGLLDFGLERYIHDNSGSDACTNGTYCCTPATGGTTRGRCKHHSGYTNIPNGTDNDLTYAGGCGASAGGGVILVQPGLGSGAAILPWADHVEDFCANAQSAPRNPELRAEGSTPLARSIQTAISNLYRPIYTASKTTPNPASPLYDSLIDCRSYVLVVMTDGDDTCGNSTAGDPSQTVAAMRAVSATNPVAVYTLGMGSPAGLDTTELNQMAVAGGTGPAAPIAQNQTEIEAAFADIVARTVKYETCNNADDNCNTFIDEGLGNYQECTIASQCGSGTCNAGRCTCTSNAQCASGNSCTNGFCRPACSTGVGACRRDGVRKCDAGAASQCCVNNASATCTPLTAGTPSTETCNGIDDNCNGIIDDVPGGCQGCVAFPEICNGRDDDCDGVEDDNLTDTGAACGTALGICTAGTTVCQNAGTPQATLVCGGGVQPGIEICNGRDDNCDGVTDGMTFACYTGSSGTLDVGVCRGGTQQCTATPNSGVEARGPCVGQVLPVTETCNGLDDDCNGAIDDVPGVNTACCSSGRCGTGICASGTRQCSGGSLQCIGEILPGTEICNNADDDCNGSVDDVPNVNTSCCPSGNCGTGVCTSGTRVCQGNQLVCVNAVGPGSETCDTRDNDCNGTVDDLPGAGQSCCPTGIPCGVGECAGGTLQCGSGSQQLQCQGATGPASEVCDAKDNDCNGTVDDVAGAGQTCCTSGKCGTGVCSSGTRRCTGGSLTCVNETLPGTEVCDTLDNDCNGAADDVSGVGTSCCRFQNSSGTNLCGTGICTGGTLQCTSSSSAPVCTGGTGPATEICDGLDNNCNGTVDDLPSGTAGGACCPSGRCGTGICRGGTLACSGSNSFTCQGAVGPAPEVCDGVDNDCNGTVDDVPGKGTSCCPAGVACGTGTCKGGTLQCSAGSTQLTCTGFTGPASETCNGLDDDCNGLTDDVPGSGDTCCTSGKCGTGVCKNGVQRCVGSALTCVNEVLPGSEVCNQLDDDCDGNVDNVSGRGDRCCPFQDGAGNDLCGTGVCASGQLACVPGQVTLKCTAAVGPGRELCDALDNDCNGVVDDLPGGTVGGSCCPSGKCGTGVCKSGTLRCGATGIECIGAVNPGGEVCDGLDNDCNAEVDDVTGVGTACCPSGLCGRGACKAGTLVCGENGPECRGAVSPITETCNGIDDNCNGIVDDIPGLGQACCPEGSPAGDAPGACNKGICRPGVTACRDNAVACVGGQAPQDELCDGRDNDCDGAVDDSADVSTHDPAIGVACSAPEPPQDQPPCKAGTTICQGARAVCQGAVGPGTEICNGRDENCDGVSDVGAVCPTGRGCAAGACRLPCSSGEFPCPGGLTCRDRLCVPIGSGTGGTGGNGGSAGTSAGGSSGGGAGGSAGATPDGGSSGGAAGDAGSAGVGGSSASGGAAGASGAAGANQGGSSATAGVTGKGGSNNHFGLATGGGGCACEAAGTQRRSLLGWAGLLLGLVVVGRRAARRAA